MRALYTDMLRGQLEHGNNGMVKTKVLVLSIEAKNGKEARARFSRITLDALNYFKAMGALAKALDGKEWLAVLHGVLHPDGERFSFAWEWLAPSGLSVKDFIVPSSFRFGEARRFQMGGKYGAASFLQITAPELNDRLLADLLDTDSSIFVSLHIRSMDQNEAIKTVKRKITDLDSMKIDAQKRAAREGFDLDIIPSDIATYAGEAKNILRDLQTRNERMFPFDLPGGEMWRTRSKSWKTTFPGFLRGAEAQLPPGAAGLPAGAGSCVRSPPGRQPGQD